MSAIPIPILVKIIFHPVLGHDRVATACLQMPWSRSSRFTLDTLIPNRSATCDLVAPEMYRSTIA
jgi:hypothetical protein